MLQALKIQTWNASFFVFLTLFMVSFAWYAMATDENGSGKNFFQDTDQDGLSNEEEKSYGTDPNNPDTDDDSYSDGVEVESGYNPLKAAPGDRTVAASEPILDTTPTVAGTATEMNYTEKTSEAVASIVNEVATSNDPNKEIKAEDISAALQNALNQGSEDIPLPVVDISTIKVKKISKNLKGEKKKEAEKKDVLQYVTLMGYLIANNSPFTLDSSNSATSVADKLLGPSISSLSSGDFSYFDTLEASGNKVLEQIKDIEVPEAMLETHAKAIQLALYASQIKGELKGTQSDPIGQVASYGKVQAFLGTVQAFEQDLQTKLADYGIQDFPLGL